MTSSKILCIGLVTVDIIQVCKSYPKEDSDQRCIEHYWQRGGNASNNCTVLAQLGADCEFFGTISGGIFLEFLNNDFDTYNIGRSNCVLHEECESPLSTVILNLETGSRTIIHANKNLPELTIEDFVSKIDLTKYSWIHFEGRNAQQVQLMMEYAITWRLQHNAQFKISIEFEKPKVHHEILAKTADVVFVGKDYAKSRGFTSMQETIQCIKQTLQPGVIVICPWGEAGATAFSETEGFVYSAAYLQPITVDTLGAGDTFCAAVIYCLQKGYKLQDSLKFGCQIAGAKVRDYGFRAVKEAANLYLKELNRDK